MFGFNSCYECGKITRSKNGYCSEDCKQKSLEKFWDSEKVCKDCGNKFQEKDFPQAIQQFEETGYMKSHNSCPKCYGKGEPCNSCGKNSGNFMQISRPDPFDKDYKTKKSTYICKECAEKFNKSDVNLTEHDSMVFKAARLVVVSKLASTSNIQRNLNLGFTKACKVMDELEAAGIVSKQEVEGKLREVLVNESELETILANLRK